MATIKHPITLQTARNVATVWFGDLLKELVALPPDDPVAQQKFVEVTDPVYEKNSKGDPKFTVLVKAAQSADFVVMSVIHTEQVGEDTLHNPLLFIVERRNRQRPSGWGATQPYGKRLDKKEGKFVPTPTPKKVIENIHARLIQMNSQPAAPAPDGASPLSTPALSEMGVFLYDDPTNGQPGTSYILHIPAKRISAEQAKAVVLALSPNAVAAPLSVDAAVPSPPSPVAIPA